MKRIKGLVCLGHYWLRLASGCRGRGEIRRGAAGVKQKQKVRRGGFQH